MDAEVFMKNQPQLLARVRVKLALRGAVQGVGFRPFVLRLATELAVTGWVNNSPQGVFIEAEGARANWKNFFCGSRPKNRRAVSFKALNRHGWTPPATKILKSARAKTSGDKSALVLPDIATCPDCLREIFDPKNRRFRYPFTNCTNCGPRFSIIEALPYDRANTSMKKFAMCPACRPEYENPQDRRFHAQPNACPVCGPRWSFGTRPAKRSFGGDEALLAAASAIRRGKIVAVKGIGGFHLMVDARNEKAVQLLRERKHREEKPFALMFPTLESVKDICEVSPLEERLLCSPEAPIVLLRQNKLAIRDPEFAIAVPLRPAIRTLGVMLPSNPLHHLLMAELNFPVVATSGNLSDEPICTDEREALERLARHRRFFSRPQPSDCPPSG